MNRLLERFFLIKPGEFRKVFLALLLIFLTSACIIIMRAVTDTLFLDSIDLQYLPLMYVAVAVVTAVASALYARIADRFPRHRIIYGLYSFYALTFAGLYPLTLSGRLWAYAVLYIYANVVVVLAILKAWTFLSDIYDARSAKRLFGFVGIGGTLAGIMSGFGIQGYTRYFGVESLIIVCAVFYMLAVLVTRGLVPGQEPAPEPAADRRKKEKVGLGFVFRDRYLFTIALIFTFTAIASAYGDYIFKATAKAGYTGAALAGFFGMFYGVANLVTLGYSLFLSSRALPFLGLRKSCLVLPLELLGGALLFFVHPGIWAASVIKFGDAGVRYTIHNSARQVMFLPLAKGIRGRLKTYMDGIIKPVSGGLGGLLLWLTAWLAGPTALGVFTVILAAVCVIWLLITIPIRKGYLNALYSSLAKRGIHLDEYGEALHDPEVIRALEKELDSPDAHRVLYALELLDELKVPGLPAHYARLLPGAADEVAVFILARIEAAASPEYLPLLRQRLQDKTGRPAGLVRALCACGGNDVSDLVEPLLEDPSARSEAAAGLITYLSGEARAGGLDVCRRLGRSEKAEDRAAAAAILEAAGPGDLRETAGMLRHDPDPRIRQAVLKGALRRPAPEDLPMMQEALFDPSCRAMALRELHRFSGAGEAVIAACAAEPDIEKRRVLVDACGRLPSESAMEFLTGIGAAEDIGIRQKAAQAMGRIRRSLPGARVGRGPVLETLKQEVRDVWALQAWAREIEDGVIAALIAGAVRDRLEIIFRLLGILYKQDEMQAAFNTITAGGTAANAIELIDSRVDWKGKAALLVLLETAPEHLAAAFMKQYREPPLEGTALLKSVHDRVLNALAEYLEAAAGPDQTKTKGDNMLTAIERVLLLKGADIFSDLSGEYLMHIAARAAEVDFTGGDSICRDGETDRSMYVIVDGSVRVEKNGKLVAELGKGRCIGEMALLDGEPRSADAVAASDVICLKIEYTDFYDLISENVDIAKGVFRVLSGRLRSMLEAEKTV